jgi:hypothetical protein
MLNVEKNPVPSDVYNLLHNRIIYIVFLGI